MAETEEESIIFPSEQNIAKKIRQVQIFKEDALNFYLELPDAYKKDMLKALLDTVYEILAKEKVIKDKSPPTIPGFFEVENSGEREHQPPLSSMNAPGEDSK